MKHNICPSSLKLCFSEKGALGKLFAALVNCKEQADRQSTLGLKEDLFPLEKWALTGGEERLCGCVVRKVLILEKGH